MLLRDRKFCVIPIFCEAAHYFTPPNLPEDWGGKKAVGILMRLHIKMV
jgi:hypothetical protein